MAGKSGDSFDLEHQITAIKAIRDMDVDRLLTNLRLVRSYLSDEQLQTPVLQFFHENLPNVTIVKNDENEQFDLRWKDGDFDNLRQSLEGFQLPIGILERLRTPGVESRRFSIASVPESRRFPKRGEVLLSVHGSPLGVYKEDDMEEIPKCDEI